MVPCACLRRRPVLRVVARSRSFVRQHKVWVGPLGAAAIQTIGDIGCSNDRHALFADVAHFLSVYLALLVSFL